MEIEAKFSLPDVETFHRLRTADQLAGFALSEGQVQRVHDTYLDTEERLILAAGYACRRREQDRETLMTLKGLKGAEGAIHRREELEVAIPGYRPPDAWPASPARDQVLQLIGEAPLRPLFDLRQVRVVRLVKQEERTIAELSLDGVHLNAGNKALPFLELEVELGPGGSEEELAAITAHLQENWNLEPVTRSKFERGLAFVEEVTIKRKPEPEPAPEPLPLEALFERYHVDQTHARSVADHALALYDHLAPYHDLPAQRRVFLETAALVHNVGLETDPDRHHVAGRDILLAHPPTGLDDQERLMVALITFLHRKRITPKKLDKLARTPFATLPEPVQSETLAMAALVRMADGLDFSGDSSSRLGQVRQQEGMVEFEVVGPHASIDAERAQKKSDLWWLLFEVGLSFTPDSAKGIESIVQRLEMQKVKPPQKKPPKTPGLEPDDSMAEAARKTFSLHFQRMLYHEAGTRLGEDIEELHDMRVATRRMRAALQVFGDYLDMDKMRPFLKGMRRTGRALGAVRDLDVFWEKTEHYLETLPADQPHDLSPLRAAWEAEREVAREKMLAYLDSKRFARFKEDFDDFLNKPGAGALPVLAEDGEPRPHRLRHVVPVAVYERLGAVLAYDEWVTGPDVPLERLHQLRITAKGLRYTLEYFVEVLGPEARPLIEEVKGLQDHLGDLQDAVVASNLLRDFLTWGTWGHAQATGKRTPWPEEPIVAPGVATYLATRQAELQRLVDTFPQVWVPFQRPEFGELVAAAVTPLLATTSSYQEVEFMATEPKYIVLLGPPASGKGTQAAQLREVLDLPHVASGDLFRENLKNETELGLQAKAYMDRGELVPDDVTFAMVMDRLSQPDTANGALLDGFPRTMAQAKALDDALAAQGQKINLVPNIAVPDEVLVERVSGRRLCRVCGEAYHVLFNPPQQPGICDNDGGELYQRDDDQPDTVRKRLQVYWEQTSPLIEYYRRQGVLVEVNGDQSIDAVQAELRAAVAGV